MKKDCGSVSRVKLNNGLTVVVEPDDSCPVVAINVWVKVGSGCELPSERGLAHLHEHMLFKGTDGSESNSLAFEVESAGGRINAYTSLDQTVYHITTASRSLRRSLDLLADSVVNPAFDKSELEKEIEVVVEEIRRDKDSPVNVLSKHLFASAFKCHPYGHSILGDEKSLRSFTRAGVLNFYRKWYSPGNMVVVIAGDFEPKSAVDMVKKSFSSLKKGRDIPLKSPMAQVARRAPAVSVLRRDIQEGYFAFAFRIPGIGDEDIAALDIVSEAMGAGESSRLFRVVKEEKGFVNTVYSYAYPSRMGGVFVIGGTARPANVPRACEEILSMFYRLASAGLRPSEIDKAKLNIESDSVRSRETMQGRAGSLGFYEAVAGDYMFEKLYMGKVRSVGADDICRVARKYFIPSNLCAVALLPKDTAVSDRQVKKSVVGAKPIASRKPRKRGKTGIYKLENGIRVIIRENKSVPLFAAGMFFSAGLRFEDKRANGVSNFMANMMTRGTSNRCAGRIAEEMESLAGHIEGFSGADSAGVSMEALSSNFDPAMDIFSDVALNPSFPQDEVKRAKREILATINRRRDSLSSVCMDGFLSALFKGSPYSRDVTGMVANVKNFSTKDAEKFRKKTFNPEETVVTVVGDVDSGKVFDRLERDLSSLSKTGKVRPQAVCQKPLNKPVTTLKKTGDKQQTHIVTGFAAPETASPDRYPFQVLNTILSGQGGRLFMKLRDEMSLAYAVTSFYGSFVGAGYFGVYIATAPHKEKNASEEILAQISGLLNSGVSKDEVGRARNKIVGDFEMGLQRNSAQASVMGFDELYGLGWDDHRRFARGILAVTQDDVLRVAEKYLKLDSRVMSVVKGKKPQ